MMLGQVMVTTESPSVLRPLLRAAIQNEAKSLTHGIKRTRERLRAFEKQFGMTSEEFERRYEAAEIDEPLESIEWLGEIKLSSFPHHKHLSDGTSVVACTAPTLAQVLAEIAAL